jgi:hypothetical protein
MTGARCLEDELLQRCGAGCLDGYAVLAELVAQDRPVFGRFFNDGLGELMMRLAY